VAGLLRRKRDRAIERDAGSNHRGDRAGKECSSGAAAQSSGCGALLFRDLAEVDGHEPLPAELFERCLSGVSLEGSLDDLAGVRGRAVLEGDAHFWVVLGIISLTGTRHSDRGAEIAEERSVHRSQQAHSTTE
jgi:hypothetical protein